ncbi:MULTISPECIES: hypothetical protein [unclassified Leisingera]|uniref:hypothetical protein n=1 Tax=unclassified Leisingera TaxID=2614906 RepID=UPI00037B93CC|nr:MULTISPECIES: hypothetical protein [unclassified Leisingera]
MSAESSGRQKVAQTAADQTLMLFDPQHGFQIVYFASEEQSWLWYPGNRISLPASVRQEADRICFKYPAESFNPVTKAVGGNWNCIPNFLHDGLTVAAAEGDVFNLSAGTVPYRRSKCDGTGRFGRGTVDPGLYRQGCGV